MTLTSVRELWYKVTSLPAQKARADGCRGLGEGRVVAVRCAGCGGVASSVPMASMGLLTTDFVFFPESGVLTQSQRPLAQITGGDSSYQTPHPERAYLEPPVTAS